MSQMLTVKEVMERLQISRSTFYQIVGRGDLRVAHFGRSVRVLESELDRLIEQSMTGAGQ